MAHRINQLEVGDIFLIDDRKEPLRVRKLEARGKVAFGELVGIEAKGRSALYVFSPEERMYLSRAGVLRRSISWILKV
jgi:hypothetical protein